jgi:hypothetical protein
MKKRNSNSDYLKKIKRYPSLADVKENYFDHGMSDSLGTDKKPQK